MIKNNFLAIQQGAALIVTLLLLFLLSVLGIRLSALNSIQTQITTNAYDALIAFSTAEGALNDATNNLLKGTYSPNSFIANQSGLYLFNPNNTALWNTVNWASAIQSYQGKSSAQAAYIIEQLPSVIMPGQNMARPTLLFRITARAVGASGGGIVMLQTIVQMVQ